jgi:hypothetical protein
MSRSRQTFVAAIVALVAAVAVLVFATASNGSAAGHNTRKATVHTLHLIQTNAAVFTSVDVGVKGFSPGDYVVITGPLVNANTHRRAGTSSVVCTVLKTTKSFPSQCVGTARLHHGNVTFQGIFLSLPGTRNQLAVTGGTGRYSLARGTATATILHNGATGFVVRLVD